MQTGVRKKLKKFLLGGTLLVLLTLIALILLGLSNALIQFNRDRIHQRLLIPISQHSGYLSFKMPQGSGDSPSLPGFLDGPVVRRTDSSGWTANWFCRDRIEQQGGSGAELTIDCEGKRYRYLLNELAPPPTEAQPMPEQLAVLSDLEGNKAFLDRILRELQITDPAGNWLYGRNQLLILGDSVDRGRDAFAVLWTLRNLSVQAQAAGGAVHVLLGNHEQYLLQGRTKSVHPSHLYATRQLGGYDAAFGADTVIGDWLRKQPVAVKLGDVLFVHGGVSPQVGASGLSLPMLNQAMQHYWSGKSISEAERDALLGRQGLTQYRGYLDSAEGAYPLARDAEVARALAAFGAARVVVGHTLVERITTLHNDLVYAVDVNESRQGGQVLLFEKGQPRIVDTGVARALAPDDERRGAGTRPLRFWSGEDLPTLGATVGASYRQWRASAKP